MLRITDRFRGNRRAFLQVGGLALGGLALPQLLETRAAARGVASGGSGAGEKLSSDKSVIFLFLHGGPSQFETFDPKPEAPAEIRSATGHIATAIPGMRFGSSFPRTAALADRLTIVRSFATGDGNHDIKPIVGRNTAGANLGSLYARAAGTNNPQTGMPTNALLFPRAVEPESQPGQESFGRFGSTGSLGAAYAPFTPGSNGDFQDSLTLKMPIERLDDRRGLLAQLDRIDRRLEAEAGLAGVNRFREQAVSTIVKGVVKAFDLSQEDPAVVARYDTAPLVRPENISRKWNNYNFYVDNAKTLGKLLLLARRLCEQGCGFVTVTTNFVWDMHADVNNATCEEGMSYMGPPLDHALSAFLEDVEARGLSEKIMLVATGEMGRTPRLNANGGRDHWGGLAPLLLAGGGIPRGAVYGQSQRDGGSPRAEPVSIGNLTATILHSLLDVGKLRLMPGIPTDVLTAATAAEPIPFA